MEATHFSTVYKVLYLLLPFIETINPKSSYFDSQIKESVINGLENMGGKMNKDLFYTCAKCMY